MRITILLTALLVFIGSCQRATTTGNPSMAYEIKTTVYQTPGCEPENKACLMASISYPVFVDGDSMAVFLANRIIKNSILDAIGTGDVESTVDPGIAEALAELDRQFIELKKEFGDYNTGWTIDIATRELFRSDSILTLEITYMTYTGGAHGNHSTRYFNFHQATGSLVPLSSFVGDLATFTAKAEPVFRKTYNLADSISYTEAGYTFLGNKFSLAANFAYLGDSIKLHYNPYEIAPYAAGDFEITVPLP